jgi:pentatricopeptide repeat protein
MGIFVLKYIEITTSMTPKRFAFLLFLCIRQLCFAQISEDVILLSQKAQPVAQKAELIVRICDQFSQLNQPDSVKKYVQWAAPLLPLVQHQATKAWLEHYLATSLVRTYPDSSLQLQTRSLRYFTEQNDPKGLLKANHALGTYQYYHGKPARERAYYLEALKYAETYYKVHEPKRYPRFRAVMYNNIANSYLDENQYEKALECFNEVEKTARESNSDELAYTATNGFGNVYSRTKQLEKSGFYYKEALHYAEKIKKASYVAVCLNNLGTYYTLTNQNEEAIKMYKRALEIALQMKDWMAVSNRLNNLGSIESVKEKYPAAERYFLQSIEYADKIQAKKPRLNAMANLARIYVQMDRLPEAQQIAQAAITLAEELNDRDVQSKLYNTLTKSYEKQKDYAKALVYQQRKSQTQDSVLNVKSLAKIQELQARYEAEKKEYQIRELSRQNQIQALEFQERNLWFALFGVSLVAMVATGAFYTRQRILKQQNQVLSINQQLLRTQINPHFFFNVLSSIQTYLLEHQDTRPAVSYLAKFGKLMRNVLENSRVEFISLADEITTLQNYLDIQMLRFEDKFEYQITVAQNLDTYATGIPPMLAQPFLENALEHARQRHRPRQSRYPESQP